MSPGLEVLCSQANCLLVDAPIAKEVKTWLPVIQRPDLPAGAPKAQPYARVGSQSPLSHAYAAFTVDSNAAP
jgi:hypothetical protein